MEVYDLVKSDSNTFWEWWLGNTKKCEEFEFRPILVEVQGSTGKRNTYSKAV